MILWPLIALSVIMIVVGWIGLMKGEKYDSNSGMAVTLGTVFMVLFLLLKILSYLPIF